MLRELKRDGNRIYFEDKDNLIIYVWDWDNDLTIEKAVDAYRNSSLPSYVPLSFSELHKRTLPICQLSIFSFGSEIKPMNMSLWEYETFIKGNNKANKKLKSAFINFDADTDNLYVAVENFDAESIVTVKSLQDIENYISEHKKEICELFNTDYIRLEIYSYPED